jgi:hypothetical protein
MLHLCGAQKREHKVSNTIPRWRLGRKGSSFRVHFLERIDRRCALDRALIVCLVCRVHKKRITG